MKMFAMGVAASCLLLVSASSIAAPIRACSNSSVTLTEVRTLGGGTNLLSQAGGYQASACSGVYNTPLNISSYNNANPNIGQLYDGLLNGENGYLAPDTFVTQDQFLDLGTSKDAFGDSDKFSDPGWIHLGNFDRSGTSFSSDYNKIIGPGGTLNISEVLNINFICDDGTGCRKGTWSLITSSDIVERVQEVLQGRSTFDNLAFFLKAANDWAVYNFDFLSIFFNEIVTNNNPVFDFLTPYEFYGTFNTQDLKNPPANQVVDISNFGVWARDPFDETTTQVPAPATIAIMGLGLLVLRLFRR